METNYLFNLKSIKLNPGWLGLMTLLFTTIIGANLTKAQVSGYIFSQSNGTYNAATSPTILATATGNTIGVPSLDSSEFPIILPFGFVFNGQTYTDLKMSSNGFITFGANAATTSISPISATTAWDGTISAWGRDLNTVFNLGGKTGNMSWAIEGSAPNRVAVIQWENFRPAYSTSTTSAYVFSFQIRLAETTNVISTVYSGGSFLIGSTSQALTAQIGLRGSTNTDYNNRTNPTTTPFGNSVAGAANNNTQAFNTTVDPPGMPADGLTYTWTPPTCLGPVGLGVSNITTNSVTLSWSASVSAPANGYDIYYSLINAAPVSTTPPTLSVPTGLSQNITGLNASSAYFVWMRSVCSSSDASNWVALPSFNTACAPINSMFENFDSYSTGSIVPNCWDRIISGSGTQTISTSGSLSAPNNLYQNSTTPANQTIVVLPVFGNINAGTHWVRLTARVNSAPRDIEFGYVTNATDANSFVLLETKSIVNTTYASSTSEYTFQVPTSVPTNARLAIKNPGTQSTALYYDDVHWELAPTCLPPTNLNAIATSPTSANITWTASTTPPAGGYDVFYSLTNTPPTATSTPSVSGVIGNTTSITGLTPSTLYFVWVRSNCTGVDLSSWSALKSFYTPCQPPLLISTSVSPTPVCMGGTATLSATADAGATIKWYDAATGGNLLASGPTYTTPILSATTNYYASAISGGAVSNVGKVNLEANATTGGGLTSYLLFTANSDFILNTVDLFPYSSTAGTAGTVTIELRSDTGVSIATATVNVVGQNSVATSVPQTVTVNFPVTGGQSYRLGVSAWTGVTNLYRDATNLSFPYSLPGVVDITGGSLATPYYYFFYNWSVISGCESARTMVTATYDPSCTMGTSEINGKDKLSIYPNPFKDVVYISNVKDVVSINILDISGRLIKTVKPSKEINLNELKSGMYLINLRMKDGTLQTVKAIKK